MAFTESEKVEIVSFLGWPGTTVVESSLSWNKGVNDRLNVILSIEKIARKHLKNVRAIDEKLEKAQCSAGVSKIDDIAFDGSTIQKLKAERRRALNDLSHLLDIPYVKSGGTIVGVSI